MKAAVLGNVEAFDAISTAYSEGAGVPADLVKALEWNARAVAADLPIAIANLGDFYHHGRGVTRDLKRARELYQEAIDKGFAAAQQGLDELDALEKGTTVSPPAK